MSITRRGRISKGRTSKGRISKGRISKGRTSKVRISKGPAKGLTYHFCGYRAHS